MTDTEGGAGDTGWVDLVGWRELAKCRGRGPALFYGWSSEAAQVLCQGCPVDEPCFWYALVIEEDAGCRFGIWGGTTPAVRAEIAELVGPGYARGRLRAVVSCDRWALAWEA